MPLSNFIAVKAIHLQLYNFRKTTTTKKFSKHTRVYIIAHPKCVKSGDTQSWQCDLYVIAAMKEFVTARPNLAAYIDQADELSNKPEPSNRDIIVLMKGVLQSHQAHQFDQCKTKIQAISRENKILKESVANLTTNEKLEPKIIVPATHR